MISFAFLATNSAILKVNGFLLAALEFQKFPATKRVSKVYLSDSRRFCLALHRQTKDKAPSIPPDPDLLISSTTSQSLAIWAPVQGKHLIFMPR